MYYALPRAPLGQRRAKRDTLLAPPNSLIIVQRCGISYSRWPGIFTQILRVQSVGSNLILPYREITHKLSQSFILLWKLWVIIEISVIHMQIHQLYEILSESCAWSSDLNINFFCVDCFFFLLYTNIDRTFQVIRHVLYLFFFFELNTWNINENLFYCIL